MERSRRKAIKRHLTEQEIEELLRETEDKHRRRRLGFLKNIYQNDSIPEVADREGMSNTTGDRRAKAWNEGGLKGLMPSFGGGRPSKLDEEQQKKLVELLRDGQPWKSQEIQHLLIEEFDVEYSQSYLGTFLRGLGLSYAKPRPKRPHQPENPKEILEERVDDALDETDEPHSKHDEDPDEDWMVDDDIYTDSGTVLGSTDISPTILKLFGYRPALAMEGSPLAGLLDTDHRALSDAPEPEGRTYLSQKKSGSSEVVTDRLEQLWYLE